MPEHIRRGLSGICWLTLHACQGCLSSDSRISDSAEYDRPQVSLLGERHRKRKVIWARSLSRCSHWADPISAFRLLTAGDKATEVFSDTTVFLKLPPMRACSRPIGQLVPSFQRKLSGSTLSRNTCPKIHNLLTAVQEMSARCLFSMETRVLV